MSGESPKRKYWRRHERVPLEIECEFSDGTRFFTDRLLNLSLGGAGLEIPKKVEPNTPITLIIPSNPPAKVRGKVVWCRRERLKYRIGIMFFNVDQQQSRGIREFISATYWERIT